MELHWSYIKSCRWSFALNTQFETSNIGQTLPWCPICPKYGIKLDMKPSLTKYPGQSWCLQSQRNLLSKTPQVQGMSNSKELKKKTERRECLKYHHWNIKIRKGYTEQRPLIQDSLSRIDQWSEEVRLCTSSWDIETGHNSLRGRTNSKFLYQNPKQNW